MSSKTAKNKKPRNNKTKKCKKRKDRRFKVNGKDFRLTDAKNTWTRFRICENGTFEKIKPKLWSDDANKLWEKIIESGLDVDVVNIILNNEKLESVVKESSPIVTLEDHKVIEKEEDPKIIEDRR